METTVPAQARSAVQWRRLDTHLWVGRRDGAPVGMVEQGRRYVASNAEDVELGAFRTLEEAQAAVETGTPPDRRGSRAIVMVPWVVTGLALLVSGAGGAVLLLGG